MDRMEEGEWKGFIEIFLGSIRISQIIQHKSENIWLHLDKI